MNMRIPRSDTQRKAPERSWKEIAVGACLDKVARRRFGLRLSISFRASPMHGRFFPWLALLLAVALRGEVSRAAEPESTPFRIGFSRQLFTEVNINDAKASVKAWAQTVARERDIPVEAEPAVLDGTVPMQQALAERKLDALALTSAEFRSLSREVKFDPIFLALQNRRTNVEYLLLVPSASDIRTLGDLRGRSLACYENARTSLALLWLDTQLAQQGCPGTTQWVSRITRLNKVSAAVLPVFFRQMDACLVDRGSFETMCELNPQVGKRLEVRAASAPLVPMLFCLRGDYSPQLKPRIVSALRDLHTTAAGQQVLTVFQMERLMISPLSCLDSALELLASQDRLLGETNRTQISPARQTPGAAKGGTP